VRINLVAFFFSLKVIILSSFLEWETDRSPGLLDVAFHSNEDGYGEQQWQQHSEAG
jgi:hypothetical protein